ncbi:hypothetical protein SAMN04487904_103301 [Actinopolyspora lacussalsi subsp. righensis]|uniref:Uncharacterized protein n=1 Tax=Actinopolyspora righensis TaxID=995060 RepID=A0A1I6YWD7_9ACTN|nr:hypothetical protein SAMN04487904_103301 [Actinopolyspora righensis]
MGWPNTSGPNSRNGDPAQSRHRGCLGPSLGGTSRTALAAGPATSGRYYTTPPASSREPHGRTRGRSCCEGGGSFHCGRGATRHRTEGPAISWEIDAAPTQRQGEAARSERIRPRSRTALRRSHSWTPRPGRCFRGLNPPVNVGTCLAATAPRVLVDRIPRRARSGPVSVSRVPRRGRTVTGSCEPCRLPRRRRTTAVPAVTTRYVPVWDTSSLGPPTSTAPWEIAATGTPDAGTAANAVDADSASGKTRGAVLHRGPLPAGAPAVSAELRSGPTAARSRGERGNSGAYPATKTHPFVAGSRR